jgi:hypothetical protein
MNENIQLIDINEDELLIKDNSVEKKIPINKISKITSIIDYPIKSRTSWKNIFLLLFGILFIWNFISNYLPGDIKVDFSIKVQTYTPYHSGAHGYYTDGMAVYNARAVCRYYDTVWVDYSNTCEQLTVASTRFAAPEEETLSIFEVYPNPATDKLTIKVVFKNEEALQLQFISTLGQIIETHPVSSQEELSIDISDYTSGMYMLHLVNNKG